MPVKRREIVAGRGGGMRISSCIQKRSLPLFLSPTASVFPSRRVGRGRPGEKSRAACTTSSGVLYNSSSFFLSPRTSQRRPLQPFVSSRAFPRLDSFSDPLRRRARAREKERERASSLGDNGSHQASGINYARLSPREKLRAGPKLELVARTVDEGSCRPNILLDEFSSTSSKLVA